MYRHLRNLLVPSSRKRGDGRVYASRAPIWTTIWLAIRRSAREPNRSAPAPTGAASEIRRNQAGDNGLGGATSAFQLPLRGFICHEPPASSFRRSRLFRK